MFVYICYNKATKEKREQEFDRLSIYIISLIYTYRIRPPLLLRYTNTKGSVHMKFNITGRNISVSDKTKDQIEKKLGKLSKFFADSTVANVTLSKQKDDCTIEVTIPIKNSIIRAEETSEELYVSIDLVEEILERQIKRHRAKLIDKTQNAESFSALFNEEEDEDAEDEDELIIEKVKKFDFKPMSPEEACLQMELLGHSFFVFKDDQTNETCVVYKRKNKGYGLIVPEH